MSQLPTLLVYTHTRTVDRYEASPATSFRGLVVYEASAATSFRGLVVSGDLLRCRSHFSLEKVYVYTHTHTRAHTHAHKHCEYNVIVYV